MDQQNRGTPPTPHKRNPTLRISNTISNPTSRRTSKFTAPPSSRSIRATSLSTRRRSLLMSWIKVSTGLWAMGERAKSSRIAVKCGEVVGLSVERAKGIQNRPPRVKPDLNPSFTSRRFGNFEKSKDRSKASISPGLEGSVSVGIPRTRISWSGIYRGM